MNTPKSQFYQASSTGRFQFKFKPSVEIGGFPSLTPCHSDKSASKLDWFGGPSDLLEKQKALYLKRKLASRRFVNWKTNLYLSKQRNRWIGQLRRYNAKKISSAYIIKEKKSHPLHYLGDKNYPYPEIDSNFYKQNDGLVAGSNIKSRIRHPYKVSKSFMVEYQQDHISSTRKQQSSIQNYILIYRKRINYNYSSQNNQLIMNQYKNVSIYLNVSSFQLYNTIYTCIQITLYFQISQIIITTLLIIVIYILNMQILLESCEDYSKIQKQPIGIMIMNNNYSRQG